MWGCNVCRYQYYRYYKSCMTFICCSAIVPRYKLLRVMQDVFVGTAVPLRAWMVCPRRIPKKYDLTASASSFGLRWPQSFRKEWISVPKDLKVPQPQKTQALKPPEIPELPTLNPQQPQILRPKNPSLNNRKP